MDTLEYIIKKYHLAYDDQAGGLIEIPNVGRDDLAKLLDELDFKTGVEVGVEGGYYSEELCKLNPRMKIYGVDAWEHHGSLYHYSPQEAHDSYYQEAAARLAPYPNYEIVKKWSLDAVKDFADNALDFVYIDANHEYPSVMEDISQWSKKVKTGGIVSGHDYFRSHNLYSSAGRIARLQAKEAVDDYVGANNIKPLIIWGAKTATPGMIRDRVRSWSWVKA